jgi:Predicted nucleotide-binding protein containing TIR -like domain
VRDRLLELREAVEGGQLPTQLQLAPQVFEASQPRPRRGPLRFRAMPGQRTLESNDVFLVCGRDSKAIDALRAMLNGADIHLVEWEEARGWTGNASPYVLDVIKAALDRVKVILVLMTPEEKAELRADLQRPDDRDQDRGGMQPRPNVLVELGMALSVAGQERTVIVEIAQTRGMTDLEGVHTLRFTDTPQKRNELINRLKSAGIEARGDRYLTDGDFSFLTPPPTP